MTMRLDIVTNDAGDLVRREHARDLGAGVVVSIYRLAKLAQMHDLSNQAFVRQLEQTTQSIHDYCLRAGSNLNILCAQKAVFVAGQLLKGSRTVYEQAIELGEILEWCGGSELVVMRDITQEEMLAFAEAISQATRNERGRFRSPSPKIRIRQVDDNARLRGLEIESLNPEQRIVRTYASAVVIMRRFFEDLHASRYVLPPRIKRIAQSLVDLSEAATAAFLGVTEARNANHDDAGKAVNTAILAVAMARELNEERVTLAQIAMAAMMHDVGRPRAAAVGAVPGMPQMPGVMSLSEEQEDRLAGGTAAVLTALGRVNEPSITRTVVAFEALWLRRQQWIGPVYRGARAPTLHAKIVTVARRYNDLMTPEPGLPPRTADFAVATLSEELKEPADKTVLRMLVAALGLLPVGTVVQLSTGEVCEVVPRAEPGPPDRPKMRVALDAQGGVVSSFAEIDLAREPERRILRVMSVDGWKKGLETKHQEGETSSAPPSAQSGSGLRTAQEYSSPSRSVVSPSRGTPQPSTASGPQAASGDGSPPSMSSISSAASVQSLGSSPSAVAEAMGKMINETLKTDARLPVASIAPISVRSKPPDDARTIMQESPFAENDNPSSMRLPLAELATAEAPALGEATARGSLEATPLAHVLVYMLDHALSGSVVFNAAEGDHVMYFSSGVPAKARLAMSGSLLGEELAEMGALAPGRLDEIAEGARRLDLLFGEYCVGHNLVSRDTLERALEAQLIRTVSSLANLAPNTTYAYYRDANHLDGWGGFELTLAGPLNAILATVRVWHDRARVRATLARIGKHPLVFHDDADLEKLRPNDAEQAVLDAIVTKRCSLPQLFQMRVADEDSVSSVVYTLAVTRQFAFKGQKKAPMAARPRVTVTPPASQGRVPVSLRPVPWQGSPPTSPKPPRPASTAPLAPVNGAHAIGPSSAGAIATKVESSPELELEIDVEMPASSSSDDVGAEHAADSRERGPMPVAADVGLSSEAGAERALEAMTNFRLAETALQRGDMQLAERLAKKAAEGEPEQAEYVALYAWIGAMGGSANQVAEAIDTISRVLREDPTCERAYVYRGKLHKRASKTKEALQDFEAVLKMNPKHREAASEVRLLRMHSGKPKTS